MMGEKGTLGGKVHKVQNAMKFLQKITNRATI